MTYSIVVPCYGSASSLPELVERICTVFAERGESMELILVNDSSADDTWSVIERLAGQHPFVRGFDLMTNVGQFRALICGLEQTRGEFVLTLDDDLQHPPEEIPKLIETLRSRPDLDCVIGAYAKKRHGLFRKLGTRLASGLNRIVHGKPSDLTLTSFRIMRRQLAGALCQHPTARPIAGPMLLACTRRIGNVTVEHHPRPHGASNYSAVKLVGIVVDNVVASSTLPLKAVGILGLFSTLLSLLLGAFYLYRYLIGAIREPGFTTTVLLITFFGGATLLSIGILGEYVSRIVHEVARPPRYVVRQTTEEPVE